MRLDDGLPPEVTLSSGHSSDISSSRSKSASLLCSLSTTSSLRSNAEPSASSRACSRTSSASVSETSVSVITVSSVTFSASSWSIRSFSAITGSWRISIDWIMRGASFICWLIFICCEIPRCMTVLVEPQQAVLKWIRGMRRRPMRPNVRLRASQPDPVPSSHRCDSVRFSVGSAKR